MSRATNAIRNSLSDREMRERMVRVARGVLKNADDSEDAAHDAVVQALSAADRYRSDAAPSTWLHRVTVNAALMRRRKAKRSDRHVADAKQEAGSLPWLGSVDPTPSPTALLEERQERGRLERAVASLPRTYREVLVRHVYGEESPEEVARHLGLTTSAVRTRIGRARQQLEALLTDPHEALAA